MNARTKLVMQFIAQQYRQGSRKFGIEAAQDAHARIDRSIRQLRSTGCKLSEEEICEILLKRT